MCVCIKPQCCPWGMASRLIGVSFCLVSFHTVPRNSGMPRCILAQSREVSHGHQERRGVHGTPAVQGGPVAPHSRTASPDHATVRVQNSVTKMRPSPESDIEHCPVTHKFCFLYHETALDQRSICFALAVVIDISITHAALCSQRFGTMSAALMLSASVVLLAAGIHMWSPRMWHESIQTFCSWDHVMKARFPGIPGFSPFKSICYVNSYLSMPQLATFVKCVAS